MRTPISIPFVALVMLGCEAPKAGPLLFVRMDSTAYTRDSTGIARANFTVTNQGSAAAVYQGCPKPPFAVDSGAPGTWREYGINGCQGVVLLLWHALQPGESYRDTFAWDSPATYRIRVSYGPDESHPYASQAVGAGFTFR